MCFGPSTLGAGAKTRLESRIKKFTPHCICRYTFAIASTPMIIKVEPPFGSMLGDIDVTLTGTGLPKVAGTVSVEVNNRPCKVKSAASDGTSVVCTTSRRLAFEPNTVKVRDTNGPTSVGYALHDALTIHRYLDRWSQVNSWLNDEPPVEGDTVIIPSDQTIIIDIPLPKLFLVLIQGYVIFQPGLDFPLNMDAQYILVYGGTLVAGTSPLPPPAPPLCRRLNYQHIYITTNMFCCIGWFQTRVLSSQHMVCVAANVVHTDEVAWNNGVQARKPSLSKGT